MFDVHGIEAVHAPIVEAAHFLTTSAGRTSLSEATLIGRLKYELDHEGDCHLRNMPTWPGVGGFSEHPTGAVSLEAGAAAC